VWDLASARETAKLKGHLTACTCLSGDNQSGTMMVTGSEDTNVKIWDLRMKTN
jgi:WD40 repeat protein